MKWSRKNKGVQRYRFLRLQLTLFKRSAHQVELELVDGRHHLPVDHYRQHTKLSGSCTKKHDRLIIKKKKFFTYKMVQAFLTQLADSGETCQSRSWSSDRAVRLLRPRPWSRCSQGKLLRQTYFRKNLLRIKSQSYLIQLINLNIIFSIVHPRF